MTHSALFYVILLLLKKCYCDFTEFPVNGNYWEFQPLILQWSHNFTDIRGCVWSYIGGNHTTDYTFISYGTKEGLDIKILGWDILDINRPCAGGITKKYSKLIDAGRYEMRVVTNVLETCDDCISTVGIVNPNDRSVQVQIGSNVTELIPVRDDNMTMDAGSGGRCMVILNDKYPDDTCTTVHRIGQNQSELICNKTIELSFEDHVMHVKISVALDVVKAGPFVFYVETEGQAAVPQDNSSSPKNIIYSIIGTALILLTITVIIVIYFTKLDPTKLGQFLQWLRRRTGRHRARNTAQGGYQSTALPDNADTRSQSPHLPYSSERQHLIQVMDTWTIENIMTQIHAKETFNDHMERINDIVSHIVADIQSLIREDYEYRGNFIKVGIIVTDDVITFEYLYENYITDIEVYDGKPKGKYRIYTKCSKEREIRAQQLAQSFNCSIERAMEKINLPKCVQHGGFKSPNFSGIRLNGTVCTLLFLLKMDGSPLLISIDMSTAIKPPKKEIESYIDDISLKMKPFGQHQHVAKLLVGHVHLVPKVPEETTWQLTTAAFEAMIMGASSDTNLLRCAIKTAKVINKTVESEANIFPVDSGHPLVEFMKMSRAKQGSENDDVQKNTNIMTYCHMYLPPAHAKEYNEVTNPLVAINHTAVKYIALEIAQNEEIYDCTKHDDAACKDLIKDILKVIGHKGKDQVPHYFFPHQQVHIWSFGKYTAQKLEQLENLVSRKCQEMLSSVDTNQCNE